MSYLLGFSSIITMNYSLRFRLSVQRDWPQNSGNKSIETRYGQNEGISRLFTLNFFSVHTFLNHIFHARLCRYQKANKNLFIVEMLPVIGKQWMQRMYKGYLVYESKVQWCFKVVFDETKTCFKREFALPLASNYKIENSHKKCQKIKSRFTTFHIFHTKFSTNYPNAHLFSVVNLKKKTSIKHRRKPASVHVKYLHRPISVDYFIYFFTVINY